MLAALEVWKELTVEERVVVRLTYIASKYTDGKINSVETRILCRN